MPKTAYFLRSILEKKFAALRMASTSNVQKGVPY
jgi:hypothetical protein